MRLVLQCLNYFIIAYVVKAVVAVAGLGSRLLPASKEVPKKMFPIFDLEDGEMVVNGSIGVASANAFRFGLSRQLV
jgi:UTP-glucose-1-phosphate uridylyltransferase